MNEIEFLAGLILIGFAYLVGIGVGRFQVANNLDWFGREITETNKK